MIVNVTPKMRFLAAMQPGHRRCSPRDFQDHPFDTGRVDEAFVI
jgi:hypothetical protein